MAFFKHSKHSAVSVALIAALAGVLVAGCGQSAAPAAKQTITKVSIATLPVADTAVAVVAQKEGYFKQHGLDVKLNVMQLGPATTQAVLTGAAQFSQSNYATLFTARSKGVPIEIVCEATRALPAFSTVAVLPNSTITSPADLAGKRVATSVIGGIGPLAIDAYLKSLGVDYQSIKWVQMPFPDMGAALQEHQVDAAWLVEPFVSILGSSLHTRTVFPVFSGPTAGLPVAAFATSTSYAKAHPSVVAAFRAAIQEAAQKIAKDPAIVRQVLPTFTAIKAPLAQTIGLETYSATTSLSQIERVATMMRQVGLLTSPLNVKAMVFSGK
ncbi:MAG: ABC transporter substrate-binding protein [Thermaerobacter sp.]|nr:ABC transporter substrate-binding protein [Thermaerobacter sp.]